ncbi:MAG: OmpA family protein [Bacteroidetes bacterium]|nr:OmpA family protein [Bacteroidota bacterium]
MKYFLLAALIPLTLFLGAQDKETKTVQKYPKVKAGKKLKISRKLLKDGSYYNAASYLEDVYKDKPNKIDVPHLLGESNRFMRDYEAAEKYYKLVIEKDPEAYVNDNFYLGQMQKMNGRYEDAKKSFNAYMAIKLDKRDDNLKALAQAEIEGCDSALVWMKNTTKIKVVRTEGAVNSPLQDYSPKPFANNRVLFSSQQTDTAVDLFANKANYESAIYMAEKAGASYSNKTKLPSPPNADEKNVLNAIMSGDEKTLIYTMCQDSSLLSNWGRCKLYRTTKKDALNWNEPEELTALNNPEGTSTQAAFGVDAESNNILYFVSDRKGTKGGLDIFYAKMNSDGTFGEVVNAGDEVNTAGDDITPSYDMKNKVLYFATSGRPTMGGLDIYKVSGTPGKWGVATNMGVPVNSQADDLYFALDEKGNKGFMVSNRVGTSSSRGTTCCDDIWSVNVKPDVTLKAIYVKRGDATNTPVSGVDASMYKSTGNNFEFVNSTKTTNVPFYFALNRNTAYKVNGNLEGYWPSIDNLTVAEEEERDTIEQTFFLDPIIKIHIKIPNVYFAFDKSNVIDFYKGQIDSVVRVMNEHPGYSVEIQGHTDNKGTDEYNEKLSQRRSNEVKTFLIKKKKIAEGRIVAKWFGEKMPAVPNELPNGEDDPEGRARNRRVEFKIIVDKAEDGVEFESVGEVVKQVKTGPGFTGKKKK